MDGILLHFHYAEAADHGQHSNYDEGLQGETHVTSLWLHRVLLHTLNFSGTTSPTLTEDTDLSEPLCVHFSWCIADSSYLYVEAGGVIYWPFICLDNY